MNIWDPFHPVAYFLHTVLGVAGILCAIVALLVTKGSVAHRSAGVIFAIAATVAAATALAFSFSAFAPMAIASAAMSISAVGSALLALRRKSWSITTGEIAATLLMALVLAWLLYGAAMSASQGGLLWIPPVLLAAFPAGFLAKDIIFLKQDDASRRSKRLPRHLSRMSFAFTIAVHSPIVVFADRLNVHPSLAFYAPLMIWPIIVILFNGRLRKGMSVVERL